MENPECEENDEDVVGGLQIGEMESNPTKWCHRLDPECERMRESPW